MSSEDVTPEQREILSAVELCSFLHHHRGHVIGFSTKTQGDILRPSKIHFSLGTEKLVLHDNSGRMLPSIPLADITGIHLK